MSSLFSKGQLPVQQGYDEIVNGVYRSRKSTIIPGQGFIPSMNMSRPGNMQNGVSLLPGPITINGQTVEPLFRHNGARATVSTFPPDGYGSTFPMVENGAAILPNQGSPLLGELDDSVKGAGGDYYMMASSDTYQVTTEDIFFESMFKYSEDNGTLAILYSKSNNITFFANLNSSSTIRFKITDGVDSANIDSAAIFANNCWYYIAIFINKDGSAQLYVGNVTSGAAVDCSLVGSLTNTDNAAALTYSLDPTNASYLVKDPVALLDMYVKDNWLASHLNQSFVNDRFATLIGTKAISARGTSIPTTATRASTAYLQKDTDNVVKLYAVGANWNRLERVTDLDGVEKVCINNEAAETNSCIQNRTMENVAWTKRGSITVADNTAETTDPEGGNTATKITGIDSTPDDVFQVNSLTVGAGGDEVAASIWIKRISTSGTVAFGNSHEIAKGKWTIDLAAIGTGWVRIDRASPYITVVNEMQLSTITTSFGPHIYLESGSNLGIYVWNPMAINNGTYQVGSDIGPTLASPVQRAADSLIYKLDDGALEDGKGATQFDLFIPDQTVIAAIEVLEISDGGAAADRFLFEVDTDGTIKCTMDASGGTTRTATVAGDCADGKWHRIHLQWQVGQLVIRRDGVAGTNISAVVAADIPDDLDSLTYGTARVGNVQTFLQPYYPGP
jgi:hypothetical protein